MSGNVVPATGDVQFLSNASSNAVCQVFGLATTDVTLSSLVGRPYNPSVTAAPVFTSTATVRNLPLSLQRDLSGASLFMATPLSNSLGGLVAGVSSQVFTRFSGATGATGTFFFALGTSAGTSNALTWTSNATETWITLPTNTLSRDVNYYMSAVLSNTTNGRKSLAISNITAYGQPLDPTVTFTITTPSNWNVGWTDNTSNVTINRYDILLRGNNNAQVDYIQLTAEKRTFIGTTELAYDISYDAVLYGVTNGSSSTVVSAKKSVPPLAAPVLTNFTGLPNRSTQNLTVNWGAVTGALEYDVYIGNTEVSRGNTGTSATISISSYTGSVKSVTVYARNRIKTSPASTSLEFFLSTTPVSTTPSVTFSRSTTHSIVAVGAGGVSGAVSSGWTAGTGGPGGIVSLQSYASRSTLYYNVGGSGDGGASYFSHGKGGGATAVYTETPDTIVIAGGGGGGGTIYNLGLGADDFDWHNAICTPGGGGGNNAGNGSNGGDSNVSQTGNQNGYSYYFYSSFNGGRGGDQSSGGAAAPNGTYSNPSSISFFGVYDYNVNGSYSFPPTAGVNSSGGRGGALYWFMYCIGGGGGNGFKAGGGGGASTGIGGQHNGYEEFVGWPGGYVGDPARRVIAGAGGGGGGSSWVNGGHGNPDGTITHGSGAGVSGMVFIAQRV